jgi:A/G-specific adenine glycosylase
MPEPVLTPATIRRLRATVYDHFRNHGRTLPWRADFDSYHIFVSEVMLQQTQVERVAMKFKAFINRFPDFTALASAPLKEVLALWQGLGYNRRALNLKRAAEAVLREHGGALPATPEALSTLPGIGRATAASIVAFAFNLPTIFLETNIRTVLIHHFFNDATSVSDAELLPLAEALIDKRNPRKWYSALMDYGTSLKKLHGNASRLSARYKTQGSFEGSRRQKRGKILKLLLDRNSLNVKQIADVLAIDSTVCDGILAELVKDGIISKARGRYRIA